MLKFLETRTMSGTGLPKRITDAVGWNVRKSVDVYADTEKGYLILTPLGRDPRVEEKTTYREKPLFQITSIDSYNAEKQIVRLSPNCESFLKWLIEEFEIDIEYERVDIINCDEF